MHPHIGSQGGSYPEVPVSHVIITIKSRDLCHHRSRLSHSGPGRIFKNKKDAKPRPATRQTAVTIHLSIDFLHMGRVGDWVMGEGKITRVTKDVAFVEARAHVRGVDVVRATGVFKLMHKRA